MRTTVADILYELNWKYQKLICIYIPNSKCKLHPVKLVDKAIELRLRAFGYVWRGDESYKKDVLTRGERPQQVAVRKDMQVGDYQRMKLTDGWDIALSFKN